MECDSKSCALTLNLVPATSDKISNLQFRGCTTDKTSSEYIHGRVPYTGHSGMCPVGTTGYSPLQ